MIECVWKINEILPFLRLSKKKVASHLHLAIKETIFLMNKYPVLKKKILSPVLKDYYNENHEFSSTYSSF